MSFKLNQSQDKKTWKRILVEESDYNLRVKGQVRDRTFRRMYFTVLVWFATIFLLYISLFYIGAFFDAGKVLGISQSQRAEKSAVKAKTIPAQQKRNILSSISDRLSVNRVYLLKGQTVQAIYSLPDNTLMTVKIKQCKSQPVLEVFKCKFIDEQEKRIRNGGTGVVKFSATQTGFYYFEDEVVKLPGHVLKLNYDYKIIWQRGG
ncbi:MAG: hypothetical protein JKX72_02120 [Robiginitomaculum sp.]|nr:hypothetical protein [Robiginitomaculum sp.]